MHRADFRVLRFGDIDSTNDQAMRHVRAGDGANVWFVAQRQLQGKGRQGRSWVSEPGNLYATVLVRPVCTPAIAATLSFVCALALHDALGALVPDLKPQLALKWPNDVLCGGAKISGILLESAPGPLDDTGQAASDGLYIAAGVGVNCAHHPAGLDYEVTSLNAQGAVLALDDVFNALNDAFAARYAQWADGRGFAVIRAAWLQHAAGLGQPITVSGTPRERTGIFEGLDQYGALLINCDGVIQKVTAGDIFLARTGETPFA